MKNKLHLLVSIGSCGLHMIHSAFHAGAEATEWIIKTIVTGAYYVLHDSPARRKQCLEVTGSNKFPWNFSSTC